MILKMNSYPQETLAGGKDIGPMGACVDNDYIPDKIINTTELRSELIIDTLNWCEHTCDGCYIKRKTDYNEQDLTDAVQISEALEDIGIICEEIFLGPTDLFSALNYETMMQDPMMLELTQKFSMTSSTTLMGDYDDIKRKWGMMEKHLDAAPARDFLMVISIDIEKYLNNDPEYMERLTKNLEILKKDTVVFIVNFTKTLFDNVSLVELADRFTEDYNVGLKIIPSFFRVGNPLFVAPTAKDFVDKLEQELPGGVIPHNIHFQMFDKYFGGDGFVNLSYREHKLYITPFLFEGITQTNDIFLIPRDDDGNYTADIISEKFVEITTKQYHYASITNQCGDCNQLPSCIARHILAYMESRKIRNCVMPRNLIREPNQ